MRKYLLGIGAAAIAALVVGCGGGDDARQPDETPTPTRSTGGADQEAHNDQDIAFATGMIPHHQQAIDMAELAADRATSAEVKDLAARIRHAQGPEIQQLTGLLERWGAPTAPTVPGTDHGGMDHGGPSGEGMMTDEEMGRLEAATGAEFDRTWVRLMIRHHEGAVAMARTERERGANTEAKDLATRIVDAQEAEITQLRGLSP